MCGQDKMKSLTSLLQKYPLGVQQSGPSFLRSLQIWRVKEDNNGGIPVDFCRAGTVEEDGEPCSTANRFGMGFQEGPLEDERLFTHASCHPSRCGQNKVRVS